MMIAYTTKELIERRKYLRTRQAWIDKYLPQTKIPLKEGATLYIPRLSLPSYR